MPTRAYLDGHEFDGETIRQMGIAFEMALASLGATPAVTIQFVRRLPSASSRLRKPVGTIPSVSVRTPCGRLTPRGQDDTLRWQSARRRRHRLSSLPHWPTIRRS
jgi:hypothetical protein